MMTNCRRAKPLLCFGWAKLFSCPVLGFFFNCFRYWEIWQKYCRFYFLVFERDFTEWLAFLLLRWSGAHMGFPKHLDTILNWTELKSGLYYLELNCAEREQWSTWRVVCSYDATRKWKKTQTDKSVSSSLCKTLLSLWTLSHWHVIVGTSVCSVQLFRRAVLFGQSVEKQQQAND